MFNKRDKSMGENNDRREDIYINGTTPKQVIYEPFILANTQNMRETEQVNQHWKSLQGGISMRG